LSGGDRPAEAPALGPRGGAKLVLALAAAVASSILVAYLAGLLVPFLLWVLAVAGVLGLLAFLLGVGLTVVLLLAFAFRGPVEHAQELQTATVDGLQTRQP